jgi:hypothetical protein
MEDNTSIIWQLTLWAIAAGVCFYHQLRNEHNSVGLSAAYLINLGIIHWTASTLYAIPGYSYYNREDVTAGLELSLYGVVAFSVGYLIFSKYLSKRGAASASTAPVENSSELPASDEGQTRNAEESDSSQMQRTSISNSKIASLYIGVGAICIFLGVTGLGNLPTISSIIAGGGNFTVVGLMLKAWDAWRNGNRRYFALWISLSALFPVFTIVTQGFIGFGIFNAILVFAFVARFYRPRWKLIVIGLALGYLGLSVFVTYMRDRTTIRSSVWGGESYESRLSQLQSTFSQAEFFSPNNFEHLERIDLRLNQNALVGASVHYMESGRQEFAGGETLVYALLAFIPRAIWPDKPVTAGSGNLVANYTGLRFEEGTSIGVGQVMEFYINFGHWGVIFGFLAIGGFIAFIDKGAVTALENDDWLTFAKWYLPGIAAMQVGGSLVDITASAAASLVVAVLVERLANSIGIDRQPQDVSMNLSTDEQIKF